MRSQIVLSLAMASLLVVGCHGRPRSLPQPPPGAGALSLLERLGSAIRAKDLPTVAQIFCPHCRRSCPGFTPFIISRSGGYDAAQWFPRLRHAEGSERWRLGSGLMLEDLARVIFSYRELTRAEIVPVRMRVFSRRVLLRTRLHLQGSDLEGHPRTDRGLLDLDLRLNPAGWKMHRIRPARVYTVRRTEAGYVSSPLKAPGSLETRSDVDLVAPGRVMWGPPWVTFDVDLDGELDLVFARGSKVLWLRRAGSGFAPARQLVPRPGDGAGAGGAVRALVAGDLDGDGRTDLFVGSYSGVSRFWLNRATGLAPLPGFIVRGQVTAAVLADLDSDGALDLYVVRHGPLKGDPRRGGQPDLLFWGDGRGGFRSRPHRVSSGWGLAACAGDLDDDGDLDLFVANEFGNSWLYENRGGRRLQLHRSGPRVPALATSCAVGDVNGDGRLDLFVGGRGAAHQYLLGRPGVGTPGGHLFRQPRDGLIGRLMSGGSLWINAGTPKLRFHQMPLAAVDLGASWISWSGFVDHDNDGDLDLLALRHALRPVEEFRWWWDVLGPVMRGREPGHVQVGASAIETRPAGVWINLSRGRSWLEGAAVAALGAGSGSAGQGHRGGLVLDLDSDGALDLVLDTMAGPQINRWRGERETGHSALLRLVGRGSNRDAIGARVVLSTDGKEQVREVGLGSGLPSGPPGLVHFGVGESIRTEEVRVRWLDGTWQRFVDLPTDQIVVLRQGGHATWSGQRDAPLASEPPEEFGEAESQPASRGPLPDRFLELRVLPRGETIGRHVGPGRKTVLLVLSSRDPAGSRGDHCRQVSTALKGKSDRAVGLVLVLGAPAGRSPCRGLTALWAAPETVHALRGVKALLPLVVLIDAKGDTRRVISGGIDAALLESYLNR